MKKTMHTTTGQWILHTCLALLLATGTALAAGNSTMYVQSKKAKLHQAPNFKSTVVAQLPQGAKVTVLKQDKRWYQVSAGENSGWVSSLVLAKHPPAKKITVLDGADANSDEQQQKARRRASSNNSAAATRGLRDTNRARMSQEDQPDYEALEKMKSQSVSEEAAAEFIDKGIK